MNERIDMKKIMFNDKYGLTQAVLDGRKTQTRRVIECDEMIARHFNPALFVGGNDEYAYYNDSRGKCRLLDKETGKIILPRYKVGEEVAIAQSYKDAGLPESISSNGCSWHLFQDAGWFNKMFVRSELMPHHIKIKDVRIERLRQLVTNEDDCIKEGIRIVYRNNKFYTYDDKNLFDRAWIAFAKMIDTISGRGTWNENPLVFVYDFELVK